MLRFHLATIVVDEYDRAINYYVGTLGFTLVEDTDMGGGKRWVVVRPGPDGTGMQLAKAATSEQRAAIGNQTGGRVGFFLRTDDFDATHREWSSNGVIFALIVVSVIECRFSLIDSIHSPLRTPAVVVDQRLHARSGRRHHRSRSHDHRHHGSRPAETTRESHKPSLPISEMTAARHNSWTSTSPVQSSQNHRPSSISISTGRG